MMKNLSLLAFFLFIILYNKEKDDLTPEASVETPQGTFSMVKQ